MKREIITQESVKTVHNQGGKELAVPHDAIVTPAAVDQAASLGIRLTRLTASFTDTPAPSACRAQGAGTDTPAPSACRAQGAGNEALVAEIKKLVLDRLPPTLHNSDLVDQLVRKVLRTKTCECDSCRSAAMAAPEAPATAPAPWKEEHAGVTRFNSTLLPWTTFADAPCKERISIIDALTAADNAPFAVGYMEWEKATFAWHLDYHEVNIVLQGELHITVDGKTLKGKAGDVLYIPKGSSIEFGAPGHVRFVYVTWPANWAGS